MKPGPEKDVFDHYAARLSYKLDVIEVVEKRNLSGDALKRAEAELLKNKIPGGAFVVVFDEQGQAVSSRGFANDLQTWQRKGIKSIALLVGGADGVHDSLLSRADRIISLGRMTWPHMLVRGLIAEQLFRSQCILGGHPYHRD